MQKPSSGKIIGAATSPLKNYAIATILHEELPKSVKEYWLGNSWSLELLKNFLNQKALNNIEGFHISQNLHNEDTMYWKGTSSGHFSIGSVVELNVIVTI